MSDAKASQRLFQLFSRGARSLFEIGEHGYRVARYLPYLFVTALVGYSIFMGLHDSALWLAENYQQVTEGLIWVAGIFTAIVILGWVAERRDEQTEAESDGN